MQDNVYNAKEAREKLNLPTTTFYRKVNEGKIPYIKYKHKLFPKEAIDAMADLKASKEKKDGITFQLSTLADVWTKQEIIRQKRGVEDTVPFKTVLAWREVNDQISMQVNEGKTILGWTTFLPLDEELVLELVTGKRQERDIPPEAIKKWDDLEISVYISTLEAVGSSKATRDKTIAAFLIRKTIKWALALMNDCDIKNWYAIATDKQGQEILEALGFKQVTTLDGGTRTGYKLTDLSRPSKLLKYFLRKTANNRKS